MVAINGIAGIDIGRHTVETLDGDDVRYHGSHGDSITGVDVGIGSLVEIRHHRRLLGVIQKNVINPIMKRNTIIRTGMAKTESMADLMDINREGKAIYRSSRFDKRVSRNVDNRRYNDPIIDYSNGISSHVWIIIIIIFEGNVGLVIIDKLKINTGYAGPCFKRPVGQLLTLFGQGSDVNG